MFRSNCTKVHLKSDDLREYEQEKEKWDQFRTKENSTQQEKSGVTSVAVKEKRDTRIGLTDK